MKLLKNVFSSVPGIEVNTLTSILKESMKDNVLFQYFQNIALVILALNHDCPNGSGTLKIRTNLLGQS
jgi:hypothetical protein